MAQAIITQDLLTSKGYTLHHVSANMYQLVKYNETVLPVEDREYFQVKSGANVLVDAGSQEPCYWLGTIK